MCRGRLRSWNLARREAGQCFAAVFAVGSIAVNNIIGFYFIFIWDVLTSSIVMVLFLSLFDSLNISELAGLSWNLGEGTSLYVMGSLILLLVLICNTRKLCVRRIAPFDVNKFLVSFSVGCLLS